MFATMYLLPGNAAIQQVGGGRGFTMWEAKLYAWYAVYYLGAQEAWITPFPVVGAGGLSVPWSIRR